MAKGKKISEQPLKEELSGQEKIPFAYNGENGSVTPDTLKSYATEGLAEELYKKADKETVNTILDGYATKGMVSNVAEEVARVNSNVNTLVSDLDDKADKTDVPSKVSELENDSKYQTESQVDNAIKFGINEHKTEVESRLATIEDGIESLESNKLSKTGGAIDGGTNALPLKIDTSQDTSAVQFTKGGVSKANTGWNSTYGAVIFNYASSKAMGVDDSGTAHVNGVPLLTSDNYTSHVLSVKSDYQGEARNTEYSPTNFIASLRPKFNTNAANGLSDGGNYNFSLWFRGFGTNPTDISGGPTHELGFSVNGNIWHRISQDKDTWKVWHKILDDANYAAAIYKGSSSQFVKADGSLDDTEYATKEEVENLAGYIGGGTANPELFRTAPNLCAAAFDAEALSPTALDVYGQKDFARCWEFYLVDVTADANEDGTMTPVGRLKHNNLLRFADGSFAPTVGITEAMRAECDVALYLNSDATNKWCDAGAFDAEAFYNAHGMAKLYNASGAEVRVLRPWETTETKYSIFLGTDKTLYPVDDAVGDSGRRWRGVFDRPMKWDGIDFEKYALAPTGISPSPICTVGGFARCFFFAYAPDNANCKSANGLGGITMFNNNRTYPRVSDVSQVSLLTFARGLNSDADAPYPFAEGGYHTYNVFNLCLEAIHGTKNLNTASTFGTGISSNDACSNETQWLANGGVRYKKNNETSWAYGTFAATPEMLHTATANKTYWNNWLAQEGPKEQCMEAQMAYSFAVETGVQEGVKFEFCGAEYWFKNAVIGDDRMNARVYKTMRQDGCPAFSTDGAALTFDVEVCLRMSLYEGASLSGDVFSYMGGGIEAVGRTQAGDALTGNEVDLYLQPDQRKWVKETVVTRPVGTPFVFEGKYLNMGKINILGNSYIARRIGYLPWKAKQGGSISTGECAYEWSNANWNSKVDGSRTRIGSRGRGYAYYSYCSRRYFHAPAGVSYATRYYAGLLQVLLDVSKMQ